MTLTATDSLQHWLAYIESIHPTEIELGLGRIEQVAERLGLLQPQAHVITVAGTNGKGSCVAALEALAAASDLRIGSYTSPHFIHYAERIKLDAKPAVDASICQAFAAIELSRAEISLSYFEYSTLAALHVFAQQRLDVIVLEVGLGGRLDAVNIIDADIAIVTSIALDHADWLGTDLSRIATEKAGIFRTDRWAICADVEAPASIKQYANEIQAKLLWADQDFKLQSCQQGLQLKLQQPIQQSLCLPLVQLPHNSIVAAVQAMALLGKLATESACRLALGQLSLAGRGQRVSWQGIKLMLDVAHNPAAVQRLAEQLQQSPPLGRVVVITAMMADKELAEILSFLVPLAEEILCCELVDNPRAASAADLGAEVGGLTKNSDFTCIPRCYGSVAEALNDAKDRYSSEDLVVVMGSFFTVSDAMKVLELTV